MPRSKLINPKRSIQIRLPEDLFARILSELYSEVEGCVPYAKQSEFIEMCIRDYFRRKENPEKPANEQICSDCGAEWRFHSCE